MQGFGLFDGQKLNIVRSTKEEKLLKWLVKYDSNLIMFHHRFPTSTPNVKRAAHPFTTGKFFGDNQYILIHNGHITNSAILKKEHEALGITYHSQLEDGKFNDSESLLWEFALVMEGRKEKLGTNGGAAFICVKLHEGKLDKMYYARNTNPIYVEQDETGIVLSSAGEGQMALAHHLYEWDYETSILTKKEFEVPPKWTFTPSYTSKSSKQLGMGFRSDSFRDEEDEDDFDRADAIERISDIYIGRTPKKQEIYSRKMLYFIRAKGNFENALWLVDRDYTDLNTFYDDDIFQDELRLLECVMAEIENDDGYVSTLSVSSDYRKHMKRLKKRTAKYEAYTRKQAKKEEDNE
jgi:predicted glutamine amidotransferase